MEEKKRGRGRPPKDPASRRTEKINTYVSLEVSQALHAEAVAQNMTVSELVATILEGHVFGDKKEVQYPPVSRDAIYSVIRALADEGLILGANVYLKNESSAEFAPKTHGPTSTGAKAKEQQSDEVKANLAPKTKRRALNRGKGGETT